MYNYCNFTCTLLANFIPFIIGDRSDSKELSYDDDSLISKSGQQPKSKRARSRVQRNKSDYSNESIRPKSLSPFNPGE